MDALAPGPDRHGVQQAGRRARHQGRPLIEKKFTKTNQNYNPQKLKYNTYCACAINEAGYIFMNILRMFHFHKETLLPAEN